MKKEEEYLIDDTPMDFSDVPEMTDEEYEEYWKKRHKEIQEEIVKKCAQEKQRS